MTKELYAVHAVSIDWAESQESLSEEVVASPSEIGPAVMRALKVEGCGHVEVSDNEFDSYKEPHAFQTKAEMEAEFEKKAAAKNARYLAERAADPLSWVDEIRGPRW